MAGEKSPREKMAEEKMAESTRTNRAVWLERLTILNDSKDVFFLV